MTIDRETLAEKLLIAEVEKHGSANARISDCFDLVEAFIHYAEKQSKQFEPFVCGHSWSDYHYNKEADLTVCYKCWPGAQIVTPKVLRHAWPGGGEPCINCGSTSDEDPEQRCYPKPAPKCDHPSITTLYIDGDVDRILSKKCNFCHAQLHVEPAPKREARPREWNATVSPNGWVLDSRLGLAQDKSLEVIRVREIFP